MYGHVDFAVYIMMENSNMINNINKQTVADVANVFCFVDDLNFD